MSEIPKSFWIVTDANGNIWTDGAYANEELTRAHFVRKLVPHCIASLDSVDVWHLWDIAKRNGFKMKELEVKP